MPIKRLTQRRAGGSCGPTGASHQRIARSVPAEAARKVKRAQILLAADAGVGDAAIAWISLPTGAAASTLLRKRMNS